MIVLCRLLYEKLFLTTLPAVAAAMNDRALVLLAQSGLLVAHHHIGVLGAVEVFVATHASVVVTAWAVVVVTAWTVTIAARTEATAWTVVVVTARAETAARAIIIATRSETATRTVAIVTAWAAFSWRTI